MRERATAGRCVAASWLGAVRGTVARAGVAVLVGALCALYADDARAGRSSGGGDTGGVEAGWPVRRFDQGRMVLGSAPPAPGWQPVPGPRASVWLPVPPGWADATAAGAGFSGLVDERGRKGVELAPGAFVFGEESWTCGDYAGFWGAYTLSILEIAPLGVAGGVGTRVLSEVFSDPKLGGKGSIYVYWYCVARGPLALSLAFYVDRDERGPDTAAQFDRIVAATRFEEAPTLPAP